MNPEIFRIYTDRLLLKRMELTDISNDYIAWLNDFETTKYLEIRFTKQTRELVIDYVSKNLKEQAATYHFGVFEKESNRLVGTTTLNRLDYHHMSANISFVIGHPSARNKGYATEAVGAAIRFIFKKRGFAKLWGGYYEDNIAAEKVFLRNGFKIEGRLSKKLVNYKNIRVDHVFVGLFVENI